VRASARGEVRRSHLPRAGDTDRDCHLSRPFAVSDRWGKQPALSYRPALPTAAIGCSGFPACTVGGTIVRAVAVVIGEAIAAYVVVRSQPLRA
jgi:hypothetical protein